MSCSGSDTNRHRPPTNRQLLERIYRRQIASDKRIEDLVGTNKVLAGHLTRVLREKETLLQVIEANKFMAAALPRRTA